MFAFVQFTSEAGCKRAIQSVNGTLIDGLRVTVGVAKYKKDRNRQAGVNVLQLEGSKLDTVDRGRQQEKLETLRSLRDGRTYKEVLKMDSRRRSEFVIADKKEGQSKISNGFRKVWDMYIPIEDSSWVKNSLTGILNYPFKPDMVMKALEKEGFKVKVISWGYVENACIIIFNSNDDFLDVWSNLREKLSSWFLWLSPVLNERGVPLAYYFIELTGLPLFTWNEPFLVKLAGMWGEFVCILEETRSKEDLSSAKLLLRAASPFDVPEVFTVGYYGRSFKVKTSLGGSCFNSSVTLGDELQKRFEDGNNADFSEENDGCNSDEKEDNLEWSAEVVRSKVDTWLQNNHYSGRNVGRGVQVLKKHSHTNSNSHGVSENLEVEAESIPNRDYAGLGLRGVVEQFSSAHSDENWDSYSPVTNLIPAGPTVKLKWDGLGKSFEYQSMYDSKEEDKCFSTDIVSVGVQEAEGSNIGKEVEGQVLQEGIKEVIVKSSGRWKLGFPVSTCLSIRSAPDGRRGRGRKLGSVKEMVINCSAIAQNLPRAFLFGNFFPESEAAIHVIAPGAGRENRRMRKFLINEALELVDICTASSPPFKECLEEGMTTWKVCRMIGISFKKGKKTFIEKIIDLEEDRRKSFKGSVGVSSPGIKGWVDQHVK
ncbi:hypothetical protein F3Y22_tig00110556pilonHSYRG00371 [Hibiscus syriacus]|uniref:RRM domain-containing protein n=1 Tax=Hibiscus syriacus TaxID=106335 RepID=A0A6A3A839_HIBSY|nr:hypothetical protein F3Y22_tig00110556pilonHSYRG00371 [Hibiscus syriacus]